MPPSGLLNISHGERKNGVKSLIIPQQQPQTSQYGNFQGSSRDYGQGNQGFGRGQQFSQGAQANPINKQSTGWTTYSDLKKSVSQQGHDSINYGLQQAGNQGKGYHDNRESYSNQQNKGREGKGYDGVGGWTPVGGDRNQAGHQSYGRGQGQYGQQSYGRGHGQPQTYGRDPGMPQSYGQGQQQSYGQGQQQSYGQGQQQAYGRGQLRRQDYEAGQQSWSRGQSDNQSNQKQVYI